MKRRSYPASRRKTQASQFAAALSDALHDLGFTHQTLAKALNLSRYAIDSWTRAENPALPSDENLEKLCYVLEQRQPGLGQKLADLAGSAWIAPSPARTQAALLPTASPAAPRIPPTIFIGRERDIDEIQQTFNITRLVTLTGPGGIGKTRLALRLATEFVADYAEGVHLVELSAVTDASWVVQTVSSALGIKEQAQQPLLDTLCAQLKTKHLMLILDNCEHLLTACRALVAHLLSTCSQLRILATSREALHIAGEAVWPLNTLSLPPASSAQSLKRPMQYEAVRLFVERAFFAQQGFVLTPQNSQIISKICQRLDGLPLALELAAARVRDIPLEEIATRLDDRFQLLQKDAQSSISSQHPTLRAALDWSYERLGSPERTLFNRLSVFAGRWTVAMAEAICGEQGSLGALHQQLSEKSLIVLETHDDIPQYRMLETINSYARERLLESGEQATIRAKHAAYFLALAEQAEPELAGAQQGMWLDRLEAAHDNFRAVLDWVLIQPMLDPRSKSSKSQSLPVSVNQHELALRLCVALCEFWLVRGYLSEGRIRIDAALAHAPPAAYLSWRAAALDAAGVLARQQADYAAARTFYADSLALYRKLEHARGIATTLSDLGIIAIEQQALDWARTIYQESLALWRELGDQRGIATALNRLGVAAFHQGDYETTRSLNEESMKLLRELGDQVGVMFTLNGLGEVARVQGNYAKAGQYYEESLKLARELRHKKGNAIALHNLGYVAQRLGDIPRAIDFFRESLPLFQALGDHRGVSECLIGLAGCYNLNGQPERAVRLFGSAQTLLKDMGIVLTPSDRVEYEHNVQLSRDQLPGSKFESAWQAGQTMNLEQAIKEAL